MIQKVDMQFHLSSYKELKKEITVPVLEKQITNMFEVSEQLILMKSDVAKDHNKESQQFKQEFQQMVRAAFDPSHGQDTDNLNRASIPHTLSLSPCP